MKKLGNIVLAMGIILLASANSNAQYVYTSYGYANQWNIPNYVTYAVGDLYHGYEIAHVQQSQYPGYINYNVMLYRNGAFVELRFDRYGHIHQTVRYQYNPLKDHHCSNHCGYHQQYYQTYYPNHHTKVVYVNSYKHGHKQKHNELYTNVYVEKPIYVQHNKGNGHGKKEIVVVQQQPQHNGINRQAKARNTQVVVVTQKNNQARKSMEINRSGRGNNRDR